MPIDLHRALSQIGCNQGWNYALNSYKTETCVSLGTLQSSLHNPFNSKYGGNLIYLVYLSRKNQPSFQITTRFKTSRTIENIAKRSL